MTLFHQFMRSDIMGNAERKNSPKTGKTRTFRLVETINQKHPKIIKKYLKNTENE